MQVVFTLFAFFILAYCNGGFYKLSEAILDFGFTTSKYTTDFSFSSAIMILPAAVCTGASVSILCLQVLKQLGADFSYSKLESIYIGQKAYIVIYVATLEECIFRGFPIWLSQLVGISPVIPLVTASVLFGLVHLSNYSNKPNVIVTLPQFIFGLLLSAIALKYGIITAILIHLFNNFCLFSDNTTQKYEPMNIIIGFYFAIVAFVGYNLSKDILIPVQDLLNWTAQVPKELHPTLAQSVGLILLCQASVRGFAFISGYDIPQLESEKILKTGIDAFVILTPMTLLLVLL
jgi:membrane protease YdiL (CAAX protease family)